MNTLTSPIKGQIEAIRRESSDIFADVRIESTAIGVFKLTIKVQGPISSAPDQARNALLLLGGELLDTFDRQNSLG